jgi:2-polyprenyl-3-methyl-5-hydroxy-6-metoxy-1,4-benzoquinol methylase
MWDERYSGAGYAYGTEPNDFLKSVTDKLPSGKALSIGEGEGRNAVWLAQQGFDVTAVDASSVGLQKARRLARERGVTIETVHADLADYSIEPVTWDVIVSIFCHLPPPLRRDVHARTVAGLKPGGAFVLEAYTPAQLALATGGPSTEELMMSLRLLSEELAGLKFIHAAELQRTVTEGNHHDGTAAVVQVLGIKPR